MIQAQSLTMNYGPFKALKGISFEAKKQEILGLLGPNGAGKTTAMRILTTYLHPASGSATIDGIDILKNPLEARKHIGYLPETAPLYPDMTVEEYIRFVGEARALTGAVLARRMDWVREACNLTPVWKHMISELSKGYRQRVGLAQALVHDPKVLILDEPTSGLDPLQIIGIRDLIRNLAKEKTIIFSTHILSEVEAIADKIVIINEGQIVSTGTLAELSAEVRAKGGSKPELSLEDIFISLLMPKQKYPKAEK